MKMRSKRLKNQSGSDWLNIGGFRNTSTIRVSRTPEERWIRYWLVNGIRASRQLIGNQRIPRDPELMGHILLISMTVHEVKTAAHQVEGEEMVKATPWPANI